jgi:hypothetical protein
MGMMDFERRKAHCEEEKKYKERKGLEIGGTRKRSVLLDDGLRETNSHTIHTQFNTTSLPSQILQ